MATMINDPLFLVEDYKTEDLFSFDVHVDSLKSKIETISNKSLLGIVGNYGMGKSTLLEKVHSKLDNDDVIWAHFDAWKYPERTNLWEGFVLDFVRQVAPKDFAKTLKIMDGTSGDVKKKLTKAAGAALNIPFKGSGAIVSKLADFFTTSPAKRVFQIQDIFKDVLAKKDIRQKQIYIVIEDADRSGDAGIYFIETLSHFLRASEFDNKIKVFIPIAGKSFSDQRDSYIKALDFVEFFDLDSRDFTKFVEKVFSQELTTSQTSKDHLAEWLQRLVAKHKLSFRDVKFIIRNSESKYQSLQAKGYNPDPRIVLIIESGRYIKHDSADPLLTHYDTHRQNRSIRRGTDEHLLVLAIGQNQLVGSMAETINGLERGGSNIFRNAIDFVDNEYLARFSANHRHPVQDGSKYILPLYYFE
ncbi:MAG TPA: P-loop NTPase fold protein [Candidatus Saccharimonadales bacterium]|nr:P-loop NTPase fold protein [Candidatus Saccharimonadales bacterium]